MGDLYNLFPNCRKNIRQIGDPDQVIRFYMEDYVNTYLKRLYPSGSQTLRVDFCWEAWNSTTGPVCVCGRGHGDGEDGDDGEKDRLYRKRMEKRRTRPWRKRFPSARSRVVSLRRARQLSLLNYWKQHCQYFWWKEPAHVSGTMA